MTATVAALYVDPSGIYAIDGVDCWGIDRDARNYRGPYPVVAHPPCQRWGRFALGGPLGKIRYKIGEDGGCFAAALTAVRDHGGVLEHPAHSKAWHFFGLRRPNRRGWLEADQYGGMTCEVQQGHYGHFARKKTWLYAVSSYLPELIWGPSPQRIHAGYAAKHGYEKARREGVVALIGGKDKVKIREATPPEFRDLLLAIARGGSS